MTSTMTHMTTDTALGRVTTITTADSAVLHAAAQQAPRASRLHITRRGRAVVTVAAAAPLVALALFLSLNGGSATASGDAAETSYVTISGGESLWAVASEIAPDEDPREVIAQLRDLNRLSSSDVVPGQKLAIPASYSN